jgi:hypothetical protein
MSELVTIDVESVRCDFPFWELEKGILLTDFEILILLQKYYPCKN